MQNLIREKIQYAVQTLNKSLFYRHLCLKDYVKSKVNGKNIQVHKDFKNDKVLELCLSDSFPVNAPKCTQIKCSHNRIVHCFEYEGVTYYLKRFLNQSFKDKLRSYIGISGAFRELHGNQSLVEAGIPTMQIVIAVQSLHDNFIVSQAPSNTLPLNEYAWALLSKGDAEQRDKLKRALLKRVADLLGLMHAANIFHGDFKAGNLIVSLDDKAYPMYLIDNDRTRKHNYLRNRPRIRNFKQLYMVQLLPLSYEDKWYFIRHYLNQNPSIYAQRYKMLRKINKRIIRHLIKVTSSEKYAENLKVLENHKEDIISKYDDMLSINRR